MNITIFERLYNWWIKTFVGKGKRPLATRDEFMTRIAELVKAKIHLKREINEIIKAARLNDEEERCNAAEDALTDIETLINEYGLTNVCKIFIGSTPTDGGQIVLKERARQISEEGWDSDHDDEHDDGSLAIAGACYALPVSLRRCKNLVNDVPDDWPWYKKWWKPTSHDRIRELAKSGALVIAEIDRLLREKL